jgi:hypothetical protein
MSHLGFFLSIQLITEQDLEDGSCSSDAYTESEDDDVDKEYSTDNDIHDDDCSYDSGEDDNEEDLDENSEHYSDGSEHDTKINASDKVLQLIIIVIQNVVDETFSMLVWKVLQGICYFVVAFQDMLLVSLCYYSFI